MSRRPPRSAAIPIINPSNGQPEPNAQPLTRTEPHDRSKEGRRSSQNTHSTPPESDPAVAIINSQHITSAWNHQSNNIASATGIDSGIETPSAHTLPSWSPDIYARPYIPAYLFAINRSPAVTKYSQPLKTINYDAYVQQYAGTHFLRPLGASQMPAIKHVPVSVSRDTKNLRPSSYLYYFDECLLLEAYNHSIDLSELGLYNIGITTVNVAENLYDIHIPGLKDDAPCVELGDTVLVRQIFQFPQLSAQGAEWLSNNEPTLTGSVAPGFNGLQLNAVVVGVSRAKETIRLRIRKFLPGVPAANISFIVQPNSYVPLWEAITKIHSGSSWPPGSSVDAKSSGGIQNEGNWCRRMLFPEIKHEIGRAHV